MFVVLPSVTVITVFIDVNVYYLNIIGHCFSFCVNVIYIDVFPLQFKEGFLSFTTVYVV